MVSSVGWSGVGEDGSEVELCALVEGFRLPAAAPEPKLLLAHPPKTPRPEIVATKSKIVTARGRIVRL